MSFVNAHYVRTGPIKTLRFDTLVVTDAGFVCTLVGSSGTTSMIDGPRSTASFSSLVGADLNGDTLVVSDVCYTLILSRSSPLLPLTLISLSGWWFAALHHVGWMGDLVSDDSVVAERSEGRHCEFSDIRGCRW